MNKDVIRDVSSKEDYLVIIDAFFSAIKQGNMEELVSLLRENVILHADGGGKVVAASKILRGINAVSHFLLEKLSPAFKEAGSTESEISNIWFNGSPGVVLWVNEKPVTAFNFEIDGNTISKIHALRNPDKLKYFMVH